jgi:DNA-binding MarR family transcriptional regulator
MNDIGERYDLIYTFCMTSIALKDGLRKVFLKNGYDITIDNFAILFRLWHQNDLTQQRLCELTCKNKSNLTRILDAMEKKNMIQRRSNPADRRSFIISLTEYSHSIQIPIMEIAMSYSNNIFTEINEDEISLLKKLFSKMIGVSA